MSGSSISSQPLRVNSMLLREDFQRPRTGEEERHVGEGSFELFPSLLHTRHIRPCDEGRQLQRLGIAMGPATLRSVHRLFRGNAEIVADGGSGDRLVERAQ